MREEAKISVFTKYDANRVFISFFPPSAVFAYICTFLMCNKKRNNFAPPLRNIIVSVVYMNDLV